MTWHDVLYMIHACFMSLTWRGYDVARGGGRKVEVAVVEEEGVLMNCFSKLLPPGHLVFMRAARARARPPTPTPLGQTQKMKNRWCRLYF